MVEGATSTDLHGTGARLQSTSQGCWSRRLFMKRSISSRLRASGPSTPRIDSCPSPAALMPIPGTLPAVVRRPYTPLKAAGIRIEPLISDPRPSADPLNARTAPSPPEEPPGERVKLLGLSVIPVMLFEVSICWQKQFSLDAPISDFAVAYHQ